VRADPPTLLAVLNTLVDAVQNSSFYALFSGMLALMHTTYTTTHYYHTECLYTIQHHHTYPRIIQHHHTYPHSLHTETPRNSCSWQLHVSPISSKYVILLCPASYCPSTKCRSSSASHPLLQVLTATGGHLVPPAFPGIYDVTYPSHKPYCSLSHLTGTHQHTHTRSLN